MSGQIGKIRCKGCGQVFADVKEFLSCEGCEKDECPMGKRWKARAAANAAIEAARKGPAPAPTQAADRFVCHVKTCHMEDQHDETLPYRERPMSHCISFHVMKQ